MTIWRKWSDNLTERVAGAVKERRTALGLTAAELSARTDMGKPMTRAVVSDLETGRKKSLEVSELLTLAAALEVPPITLLYPDLPDGEVEALPDAVTDSWTAAQWFAGQLDVQHAPGRIVRTVSAVNSPQVELVHSIAARDQIDVETAKRAARAGDWEDEDVQRVVKQIINDAKAERDRLTARIIELGGTVTDDDA